MDFKRFLVNKLILFFMLSTLIAVAIALMGSAFDGEARLTYGDLLAPLRACWSSLCSPTSSSG